MTTTAPPTPPPAADATPTGLEARPYRLEPVGELYAPSAIFAIRPCPEEEATKVAEYAWPEPRTPLGPGLAPELEEKVRDDDDFIDPDEEHW